MQTVKAMYDGKKFKLREPVPVTGTYEVTITFTRRINQNADSASPKFEAFESEEEALEFCNALAMECVNETW